MTKNKAVLLLLLIIILALPGIALAEEELPTELPPELFQPPISPTDVCVSGIGEARVTVSWAPCMGATQYSIWVNGNRWAGSIAPGVEIRGLQPYTDYMIYVTAANNAGESGSSSSVQFTTLPPPPGAPAAPEVIEVSDEGAIIQWHPLPVWQYIQKYRIYVDGQPVADVDPQEGFQAAELVDLEPGSHYVNIAGINENREGCLSPMARFTVQAAPAPTGLAVANRSWDNIILSWDDVPGAEEYCLFVDGVPFATVAGNAYTIGDLEAETGYNIGLSAVLRDGNETATATIQAGTKIKEEPSLEAFMQSTYECANCFTPGMVILFAIGGGFAIAKVAKYTLESRISLWRY